MPLCMDWKEVGETIKAVAPVFTAAAACYGAWIATQGLHKWRSETRGKRKAEIAEATLAIVYEMEEILRTARSPIVYDYERAKKEGVPDEIATDSDYAPEARLSKYHDFFGRFRSQRYAFAAVFSREAVKPLDGLWQCRLEIGWAVEEILRDKRTARSPEDRASLVEKRRITIRAPSGNDPLSRRIFGHVSAIETICRPAIAARAKAE